MISKNLFSIMVRYAALSWRRVLEDSGIFRGMLSKLTLLVYSRLTKSRAIASYLLCKRIMVMGRKSGWLHVSLTLKHCNTALMTYYGGETSYISPYPISLSRSGIPRMIPSFDRIIIRRRNEDSDKLVKWYLSFFSVCGMIPLAVKVTKSTFQTITEPLSVDVEQSLSEFEKKFSEDLPRLFDRYTRRVWRLPCRMGMTWAPSFKSLPSYFFCKMMKLKKNPFIWGTIELRAFSFLVKFCSDREEQVSQLWLWPHRIIYSKVGNPEGVGGNPFNQWVITDDRSTGQSKWYKLNRTIFEGLEYLKECLPYPPEGMPVVPGRLGMSLEGRGKRRIFAIGNLILQRLLRPLHKWLMEVLRGIPMDGTFDQLRPFMRLRGKLLLYCYDLSAATDRFPLRLLYQVINCHFGTEIASSAVNSCLAQNIFTVGFVKSGGMNPKTGKLSSVSFVVGQPLGYLASWPLFALSHHTIVWWCAEQEYPGHYFTRYALLGDDIVIADKRVAERYLAVMDQIGVKVSLPKSLISRSGAAEFAKRFFVRGLSVDLSPISMKAISAFSHPFGLLALGSRYDVSDSVLIRVYGVGFRKRARLGRPSRRVARVLSMLNRYRLPISLWLGDGLPVSPYIAADLWRSLSEKMMPKCSEPTSLYNVPDQEGTFYDHWEFKERTWLRGAMQRWLKGLRDYSVIVGDVEHQVITPMEGVGRLLNLTCLTFKWEMEEQDEEFIRFGNLWRSLDKVRKYKTKVYYVLAPNQGPGVESGCLLEEGG